MNSVYYDDVRDEFRFDLGEGQTVVCKTIEEMRNTLDLLDADGRLHHPVNKDEEAGHVQT